ncbi:hypothetical protein EWB00_001718 [Schistosoma japonicum]|uniref:Uncharacterized protein n=2 Tax=Schistosoma japonicum TaxID=6182 RepID=A0A4Z2DEK2_SCHJA|nr:hypothetical protein KSF78_0001201 [Schistosoma japonicum]TNN14904.1 hypothetical protein EWB00_001718 [Schistosoma japonicum]
MAESWSIGPTIHFGSHSLLPATDLQILYGLLQCRHCWFRRLYHQLAAKELRLSSIISPSSQTNVTRSPPFHSLTRAIQAVLRGFNLNRKCSSTLPTKATNSTSFLHLRIKTSFRHITVVGTKLYIKRQYWVCPSHGRRLFDLLYCSSDFNIPEQGDELSFHLTIRSIIPQGHSDFFRSVQFSSSSDESDESEQAFSVHIRTPELFIVKSNLAVSHNHISTKTLPTKPQKIVSKRLNEVNRKWSFVYNVNNSNSKHLHNESETRHTSDSTEGKLVAAKHHVHFPRGNPISAVYNLYTYATASRLERSNRIWEIEARSRYFDRLRYFISEGLKPELASQLAEDDEEAIKPSSNVCSAFDNETSKINSVKPTNFAPKRSKPRHRKRNRKYGPSTVSTLPSHINNAANPGISRNKIIDNYHEFLSLAQ